VSACHCDSMSPLAARLHCRQLHSDSSSRIQLVKQQCDILEIERWFQRCMALFKPAQLDTNARGCVATAQLHCSWRLFWLCFRLSCLACAACINGAASALLPPRLHQALLLHPFLLIGGKLSASCCSAAARATALRSAARCHQQRRCASGSASAQESPPPLLQ